MVLKRLMMGGAAVLLSATLAAQENLESKVSTRLPANRLHATLQNTVAQAWNPIKEQYNALKILFERDSKEPIPNIYPSVVNDPIMALEGTGGAFHLVEYVDECMFEYHKGLENFLLKHDTKEAESLYTQNHPNRAVVRLPDVGPFRNIRVTYSGEPVNIIEDGKARRVDAQDIFVDFVPPGETEVVHYWITRPSTGTVKEDGVHYPTFNQYVTIIQGTRNSSLKTAKWELMYNPLVENIIPKPATRSMRIPGAVSAEHGGMRY